MSQTKIEPPEVTSEYRCILENPPRYIGYKGGRGGGKSESIARALLLLARSKKDFKILCGRETMDSIRDSVHGLLSRLVSQYQMTDYEVLRSEIRNVRSGAKFIFKGFHTTGQDLAIKSTDDVNVFWGEEGQGFRWESIKILKPSIRAAGSFLIFSWNPFSHDDAVEKLFRTPGLDAKCCEVNFCDNPFFPDVLKEELKADYRAVKAGLLPIEEFNQIWWGVPIGDYEDSLCRFADVEHCMNRSFDAVVGEKQIGVDVARFGGDKSVLTMRHGQKVTDIRVFAGIDSAALVREIEIMAGGDKKILISVDSGGASSIGDFLIERGHNVDNVNFGQAAQKSVNSKDYKEAVADGIRPKGTWFTLAKHEMAFMVGQMIKKRTIDLPQNEALRRQLTRIKVKYQKASTGYTWAIEDKESYRKREGESTDYADSLFLAFYPKRKFFLW